MQYSDKGLKKYNEFKNQNLIIIGVIGNNNKGKSFLLSKISKIKLLSGTSIETKGLSVKYPDLKGHQERQLILLDSAGLETPVLKTKKIEKEENKEKEDIIIEKEKKDEEIREDKEKEIIEDKEKKEENKEKEENIEEKENISKKKSKNKGNQVDEEIKKIKEFRDNSSDKIITELFLQNFIVKASDVLLLVIGKLTYSEQKFLIKIKDECKKQNRKRIFIVHNLQDFIKTEQVINYIKNTLLNCSTFDLKIRKNITTKETKDIIEINNKENKINEIKDEKKDNDLNDILNSKEIYFTENLKFSDEKELEVFHLILAYEDSEAGKFYNPFAYEFIERIYNLITEPKKFDVFEQVKKNFENIYHAFIANDIKETKFNSFENIQKEKIIKLEYNNKELELKRCYMDEIGFSLFKSREVELKYNYFKPDENTLEIRTEIPGKANVEVSHKIVGDDTIITLTGNKYKDKEPKEPNFNLLNTRDYGDYELNIRLKAEDFKINSAAPKEGYPKFKNGICFIQYELAKKASKAIAEADTDF